jgi:CheY-like chemotaxis protein
LRITVRDTGIGIPEEAVAGLFGKFVQADASVTRRFGGTGLGLAICRELATAMGGTIGFESGPGAGTSFEVDLCLETTNPPGGESDRRPSLVGLRALVVDDHEVVRGAIQRRLEGWGMAVEAVGDGEAAMALLALAARSAKPVDVMVIDRDMPGTSGLMLSQRVRAAELARQPFLVLCSPVAVASDAAGGGPAPPGSMRSS